MALQVITFTDVSLKTMVGRWESTRCTDTLSLLLLRWCATCCWGTWRWYLPELTRTTQLGFFDDWEKSEWSSFVCLLQTYLIWCNHSNCYCLHVKKLALWSILIGSVSLPLSLIILWLCNLLLRILQNEQIKACNRYTHNKITRSLPSHILTVYATNQWVWQPLLYL